MEEQFGLKVVLLFGPENWESQLEKPAEESSALLDLLNTLTLVSGQQTVGGLVMNRVVN